MFILDKVLQLHQEVLKRYGGAPGIRDINLLDSALNRPFQTFGGDELYPGPFEKSAAIFESIILNHPFVEGNKRTGFLLSATLLLEYNIVLTASEESLYDFITKISTGEFKFEEIVNWLQENCKHVE